MSGARQELWHHDPTRTWTKPEHAAQAQSDVPQPDERRGAMDAIAVADCAVCTSRQDRAPPFELVAVLRIHSLQQRLGLSDLPMEEALLEISLYR